MKDSSGVFDPRSSASGTANSLGGKIHWVVSGGNYATLQAAIDAAAPNDVILVGPKGTVTAAQSWGNITIPAGKRLSIMGLSAERSPIVKIGSVTFSPTTGLNILENEVFLRNLFISDDFSNSTAVTFAGSAPARLRLQGCYIYNTGSSGTGITSNNSAASSSLYLHGCIVQTANTASTQINHVQGYTAIKASTEISGGKYALVCAAGNVEILNTLLEVAVANEVVRISGGLVTCGYTTIKNTAANGSGANLTAAGATLGMGASTFAVTAGTGYCVNGPATSTPTAVYMHVQVTYSNSVAAAYNKKVKNTISAIAVDQSFTSSA